MNSFNVTGNITGDPESFAPENSESVLIKFSIGNNDERKKVSEGNYEDIPSFFTLKFWCKSPDFWLQRIRKGAFCAANCRAKQETWEKDGQKHSRIVFMVNGLPTIHEVKKAQHSGSTQANSFEDDIPF